MAERRMFAKTIIDSDAFLEMPQSSQALYFHLSMRADDEGFINNPKSIMRIVGAKDDDIKVLISKKFIIPFDSGVVVIKHWKIHNYIRGDRIKSTKYQEELAQLSFDENDSYTKNKQEVSQVSDICQTNDSVGKVRLGKVSLGKERLNDNSTTSDLLETFEREFKRPLSNNDIQKINDWEDKVGYEYVIHALRQCVIYQKLNISYLDSIIVNWLDKNKTIEDLDQGNY